MRWIASFLLIALWLPGCLTEKDASSDPPGAGTVDCPILYPDGSSFDCQNATLPVGTIPTARPTLQEGWTCASRGEDDEGRGVITRFEHQDKRLGFYWDWKDAPKGVGLVSFEIFTSKGSAALLLPYQPKGFKALPGPAPDTKGDIHSLVRDFRLDIDEGDGWKPAPNATLLVGQFQGHGWYVWKLATANATHYLDVMKERPAQGELRRFNAERQEFQLPGLRAFADVGATGFKSIGREFAAAPASAAPCELNEVV